MVINGDRNKPFGPGGSARRLHPSPLQHAKRLQQKELKPKGLGRGRNRIDEGVKGQLLLGIVPPLSGYRIVANDNNARVALAA
jgi:hypothetical protein